MNFASYPLALSGVAILNKFSLLGRRTIELPGVGGIDKVKASKPLMVRVPVALRLVKNKPFLANSSRFGVSLSLLPKYVIKSALMLSMVIKIMLYFCSF